MFPNLLFNANDQHDERIGVLRDRRQIDLQHTTDRETSHNGSCDLSDRSNNKTEATMKGFQSAQAQKHIYRHAAISEGERCVLPEAQRRKAELVDPASADLTMRRVKCAILASAALQ